MQNGLGLGHQSSRSQRVTNAQDTVNGECESNGPSGRSAKSPKNDQNYKKATQYFAVGTVMIGGLMAGSWVSWTSPAYDALVSTRTGTIELLFKSNLKISITQSQFDIITAIYSIGGVIVCLPLGYLMDTFDRKRTMLALAFPSIVGWILIIIAEDFGVLCLGRFLGGIAAGGFCISTPQYACEIAHKNIRGALANSYALMNVIGVVYCYIVGPSCNVSILSWSLLGVSIGFAVALLFQPETPFYYVKKGQLEHAKKVLEYFRGENYDVSVELKDLVDRNTWLHDQQVTVWNSLKQPSVRRALGIALGLQIYQQFSGIDVLLAYQQNIFSRANLSISPEIATIIAGSMQILFTYASVKLVDRLGRRFLLLTSGIIVGLCCGVLAIYLSLSSTMATQVSFMPIVTLCIYRGVYALGCGPIPWTMAAEITPSEMKSVIGPLTGSLGWFLSIFILLFFYKINALVGMNFTFTAFAVLTFLNCLWIYFWIPETKCQSAEEIREILEGQSGKTRNQVRLEIFRYKENVG